MPGGNKNIKPEDGKQFSSEYQPAQKWTEDAALKIGNELISWMKEADENMFFEEFLYLKENYNTDLISYLRKKFSSFAELIRIAKKMQEVKLKKFGVMDKLNAQMTKFVLINNHNWRDKKDFDVNTQETARAQIAAMFPTDEELDTMLKNARSIQ